MGNFAKLAAVREAWLKCALGAIAVLLVLIILVFGIGVRWWSPLDAGSLVFLASVIVALFVVILVFFGPGYLEKLYLEKLYLEKSISQQVDEDVKKAKAGKKPLLKGSG